MFLHPVANATFDGDRNDTVEAGKIKLADPEQTSLRYRHYVPFWA